ncbi:SDR family oxidoreductase, partial [Staphylococcus epidermidis]|uniref:SDR family oxidoreductase n=1 Tax=Staphylococcus epidermidis TaxID=1282 RepID=UPI00119E2025
YENRVVGYDEYRTGKGGVIGFSGNIGGEVGEYGIRGNVVCGGLLKRSDGSGVSRGEVFDLIGQTTPLTKLTSPQHLPNILLYLPSDQPPPLTPQNITLHPHLTIN